MGQPVFDLAEWEARLSISPMGRLESCLCTDSPISAVLIEHFRAQVKVPTRLGPSQPVDRFVFAKGESPVSSFTKVNGVPHRPAGQPWPHDGDGYPLVF